MASYSVVQAKNQFSRLVNAARTGEAVEITSHGQVVARIVGPDVLPVAPADDWPARRDAALEKLRLLRESMPMSPISSVDLIRQMRDEGP